jgi:heat shock protein HtpX
MEIESDRGLQARMLVTVILVILSVVIFYSYVGIYWFVLFVGISGIFFLYYIYTVESMESSNHPRTQEMQNRLERISKQADIPTPELRIEKYKLPNALTYGIRTSNSTVVITEEMLEMLNKDEIEAVLAHEVAHIKNKDSILMSLLTAPVEASFRLILWSTVIHSYLGIILGFVFGPIATILLLLTILMSGYREFAADRGSVALTGKPDSLVSAIKKLNDTYEDKPDDDFRKKHPKVVKFYGNTMLQPKNEKRINRIQELGEN